MAIFYVYVNVTRLSQTSVSGRLLLTCESRYVADELFRKLQTCKNLNGSPVFTRTVRTTPQLWYFEITEPHQDPSQMVLSHMNTSAFQTEFASKVMPKSLGVSTDYTVSWPVIPVVDGPDWVNNRTYFIRSIRRPDNYWHFDGSYVNVSNTEGSKFYIRGVAFPKDESRILVRSDRIHIRPVGLRLGHFLDADVGGNKLLQASVKCGEWKFGELLGGFKVIDSRLVKWTDENDGDDWELC